MIISDFVFGALAMLAAEFALCFLTVMIMAVIRSCKNCGTDKDTHRKQAVKNDRGRSSKETA